MRFTALDSWRGLCALAVVLYHAGGHGLIGGSALIRGSFLFVDFFFVLSGFVMSEAYANRIVSLSSLRIFVIRRFGRIWPLHAAMMLAFFSLELVKLTLVWVAHVPFTSPPFTATMRLDAVLPNILLLHSMGILPGLTWNAPSWSIAAEFWTYVVFALVVWGLRPRLKVVAAVTAGLAAMILVQMSTSLMDVTYNLGFVRCLYGFFIGVALHRLRANWSAPGLGFGTYSEIFSAALACLFVALAHDTFLSLMSPLIFSAVIFVFAQSNGAVAKILHTKTCLNLGKWSYSIYMTHLFLLGLASMSEKLVVKLATALHQLAQWQSFLAIPGVSDGLCIAFALVVILVSAYTYRWIEQPTQRFFNRLATRPC